MSKTKHTPGPWSVDETRVYIPESDTFGHGLVYAPQKDSGGPWSYGSAGRRELDANARLIAAAPEMLEALKLAYLRMEHRQGDCYSNDYMGACCCGKDVVKAAIAKAEGRDE